jgi:hypothetical protein
MNDGDLPFWLHIASSIMHPLYYCVSSEVPTISLFFMREKNKQQEEKRSLQRERNSSDDEPKHAT